MKRAPLVAGAALVLGACATHAPTGSTSTSDPTPRFATADAMARAGQSLHGRSPGDVTAALGTGTRLRFDSGYEIWVYRFVEPARSRHARERSKERAGQGAEADAEALSELVLLVTPAGTVTRSRVRSALDAPETLDPAPRASR